MSILIVNPNSNVSMTKALEPTIENLNIPALTFTYFTAPLPSPPSIDDAESSQKSADVCFPLLFERLTSYDAFVVACYSDHPLVPLLNLHTGKPVIGIFQASVAHALHVLPREKKFGIITTGKVWEELLTEGVHRFLGGGERFAGVQSTGLAAGELHSVPEKELRRRMERATEELLESGDVGVVCLGCAGLVGLEGVVRGVAERLGLEVKVVDGVIAGMVTAGGLIGCKY
jgi:Asp/Glu/hydantoin racemase